MIKTNLSFSAEHGQCSIIYIRASRALPFIVTFTATFPDVIGLLYISFIQ